MANDENNAGCLSLLFSFFQMLLGEEQPTNPPYRLRDDFLSSAEYSFYKVLSLAVGSRYCIQCKVRLADVFFVVGGEKRMVHQNRINQKHVDFLICDSVGMKPLLGIELDDSSHEKTRRHSRDIFIESVFHAADFPLLRFPVKRTYDFNKIKDAISQCLACKNDISHEDLAAAERDAAPLCPKCNIPMVLKTATQGTRKGTQFYGCPNFPRCQNAKPL